MSFNGAYLNVTGNVFFDASGSSASTLNATNVTATNVTANTVSAQNFNYASTGSLSLTGNLAVGNTTIIPAAEIIVTCPRNPDPTLAKWQAGVESGLFSNYGAGTFTGSIYAPMQCECFRNIRYGNAPVGALRCFPCVPSYLNVNGNNPYPYTESTTASSTFSNTFSYTPTNNTINYDDMDVFYTKPKGWDALPPCQVEGFYARGVSQEILPEVLSAMSEDSLMLNIYRPIGTKSGDLLPVIFYVHGGAFVQDNTKINNGAFMRIIKDNPDCICVSVEYRLALLGWSPDEVFRGKSVPHSSNAYQAGGGQFAGVCGNQGLTDMIVALQWVQVNIGYFGGNRNNVTIWGQSAGGFGIDQLRFTPYAVDSSNNNILFHKCIVNSGAYNDDTGSYAILPYPGVSYNYFMTPNEWGSIIQTYNNTGNVVTGNLQNYGTQQQTLYASFGYGKMVSYGTDGSGGFDQSGNRLAFNAKNLIGTNMIYGYYVDTSGVIRTDKYVNSSGFASYVAAMSTTKAKYLAFDISALTANNASASLIPTVLAAQGSDLLTGGNFYKTRAAPVIDNKSIVYRSFSDVIGSVPEGGVDTSGNYRKPPDVPVVYTSTGKEMELYDAAISSGTYYSALTKNSGCFTPGFYFNTTTPYPLGISYLQFNKGIQFRDSFAKIAPFYGIAGQVRKNQTVTWVDPVKQAIKGSGTTTTDTFDIYDAWYAPFINATADSSGQLQSSGLSLRFPWAPGLGYKAAQLDSSFNLPLQFYKAPFALYLGGIDTSGARGYATTAEYAPLDQSGNAVSASNIVDNSGNPIVTRYITGFVITYPGPVGYYTSSNVPLPIVADPTGALPVLPLDYSLLPYYEYIYVIGQGFVFQNTQQVIGIQMVSDLWSFGNYDMALRSADGPKKSYVASIEHYFKGTGAKKLYYEAGSIHGIDAVMYSSWWEYPRNSWTWGVGISLALYPGSFNQLGGSGYNYTATNADYSICSNMRKYVHDFAKFGTPSLLPALDASGYGYVFNSDSSGNDISTLAPLSSFNSGAIGFLMKEFYGLSTEQLASNSKAAAPGFYLYPDSSGIYPEA